MGRLVLKLLGSPEVLHGGRPVAFGARKALALLALLAAREGANSRHEITALLWPRSDERRGRTALRSALSSLRGSLKGADEHAGEAHVVADGGALSLARSPGLETDVRALEEAYVLAVANPRTEDLQEVARRDMVSQLRVAAGLYRGVFLEGFSLDDAPEFDLWLDARREALRGRAELVHDRLGRLQLEGGEAVDAIGTASAWVGHAPLSEEAYRRLIEAQFAAGDRSGALGTYRHLRSVLTRELGAEPGPETEALAARVETHPRTAPHVALQTATPHPGSSPTLPGTPFVNRSEEFEALIGDYERALSGTSGAVALLGDAGIGKTRLAEEFIRWAAEQGADVISGRTHRVGGNLPYGTLIDALRPRLERERAPDDLLEDVWLSELSRLLPEIRDRYPDLPPLLDDEAQGRARLFEAISRVVAAMAERSPVVLFLDDLHWESRGTLDVLKYAGRRWTEAGARVLLVLGLRPEATESLPAPARWLSDLGRELPVRSLDLDPLAERDTLDLLLDLVGGTRAGEDSDLERFGRWLFEETSGHPLFVAETLKDLTRRGVIGAHPDTDGRWRIELAPAARDPRALRGLLPESVREAIGAQLSRLGGPASTFLAACAVLGDGFGFEQVLRVAALHEEEGLRALDEVLAGRLIRQAGEEAGATTTETYAFVHDKVRDVAYTDAGAARRRVFHRRALGALEQTGAPTARLARHARATGDLWAAFRYLVAAGDEAMAVFAVRDAISFYETARELLKKESSEAG